MPSEDFSGDHRGNVAQTFRYDAGVFGLIRQFFHTRWEEHAFGAIPDLRGIFGPITVPTVEDACKQPVLSTGIKCALLVLKNCWTATSAKGTSAQLLRGTAPAIPMPALGLNPN